MKHRGKRSENVGPLLQKLGSRKFWVALGALIGALCVLFGIDDLTAEKLVAVVSSMGVLAAYIITEGKIDVQREKQSGTDDGGSNADE